MVLDLSNMANETIKLGGGLRQVSVRVLLFSMFMQSSIYFEFPSGFGNQSAIVLVTGSLTLIFFVLICQDHDAISVSKVGKLRFSKPNKYWVESSQKRVGNDTVQLAFGILILHVLSANF